MALEESLLEWHVQKERERMQTRHCGGGEFGDFNSK